MAVGRALGALLKGLPKAGKNANGTQLYRMKDGKKLTASGVRSRQAKGTLNRAKPKGAGSQGARKATTKSRRSMAADNARSGATVTKTKPKQSAKVKAELEKNRKDAIERVKKKDIEARQKAANDAEKAVNKQEAISRGLGRDLTRLRNKISDRAQKGLKKRKVDLAQEIVLERKLANSNIKRNELQKTATALRKLT